MFLRNCTKLYCSCPSMPPVAQISGTLSLPPPFVYAHTRAAAYMAIVRVQRAATIRVTACQNHNFSLNPRRSERAEVAEAIRRRIPATRLAFSFSYFSPCDLRRIFPPMFSRNFRALRPVHRIRVCHELVSANVA